MIPKRFRAAVLLVALFGLPKAAAADSGAIYGTVLDWSGRPVFFATVTVATAGGVRSFLTDAKGHFSVLDPGDGDVVVTAHKMGYSLSRTTCHLASDQSGEVRLLLSTLAASRVFTFRDGCVERPDVFDVYRFNGD